MKLILKQLVDAIDAIHNIGADKTLNVKTKYTIARNLRSIQQELDGYNKARVDLIENRYGAKNKDGSMSVLPEQMKAFSAELTELLSVEIDLDIRQVGEDACTNLSAADMYLLDWMLNLPDDAAK